MLRVDQEAAFRVDFHYLMDSRLGKNNEDRISSLKIAIGQKDTALKVAKTKYLGKA